MKQPTRQDFLNAYRQELVARYDWADDSMKLAKFLASVRATLDGANTWAREGEAFRAACNRIGISSKLSLKALRACITP